MRRAILCFFVFTLSAIGAAAAQSPITGDWNGVIDVGEAHIHLILHLHELSNGLLDGTLDSPDQGAMDLPISSIAFKDKKLIFIVSAGNASYLGALSDDGNTVKGVWSQSKSFPLDFKRAAPAPAATAAPTPVDGTWAGSLTAGPSQLRLIFHIANTPAGLTATIDSPDQNRSGLPTTSTTLTGNNLDIEIEPIKGSFKGSLQPDHQSITGTWAQGGNSFPLTLNLVKDESTLQPKRPQNPTKPYPYQSIDVTYTFMKTVAGAEGVGEHCFARFVRSGVENASELCARQFIDPTLSILITDEFVYADFAPLVHGLVKKMHDVPKFEPFVMKVLNKIRTVVRIEEIFDGFVKKMPESLQTVYRKARAKAET